MTRVLVTGASRGIGRAVAASVMSDGGACVGTATREPDESLGFPVIVADQGDADMASAVVARAVDMLGGLDGLVLNAGIVDDDLAVHLDEHRFKRVIDVDLVGVYALARASLKHMIRARHGHIVVITSTAAFTGGIGQSAYAAAKAGLVGMARSLAREGARAGVTVNLVAPGLVATDMTEALPDHVRASVASTIPLRREGSPGDVAAAVRFLLSEDASYITGSVLAVDGGMAMGL